MKIMLIFYVNPIKYSTSYKFPFNIIGVHLTTFITFLGDELFDAYI